MNKNHWKRDWVCHWCHRVFQANIGDRKHYFCSARCRQAHYRAHKNYVTQKEHLVTTPAAERRTKE